MPVTYWVQFVMLSGYLTPVVIVRFQGDLLAKTIFHQGKATYFTVFFLFLIWLSIFVSILYSQKFNLFFYYSFRVDLLIKHNIDSIRPICSDLIHPYWSRATPSFWNLSSSISVGWDVTESERLSGSPFRQYISRSP